MKRDFKRVMGEGKFVLTGGLVVARYRLAFVAELRSDRIYYQQSSAPKTFSRPPTRPGAFRFLAIATDHSWNQQRAYPDG
jgi:hypothetical protein